MKIARLDLYAFGPFTNGRLDFSRKPGALQLVYGPNEAGKSTTLRALTALLYGIPVRTTDAHAHDMGKLRIGATLLDEHGRPLTIVRRKGAKHTLLDAQDKPVGDGALAHLLGGLDETLFRQMFGLDHERLREGAEALLAGGGHVGEGLFDAGTGARTIRSALDALRAEAEGLFKPRGKTPKLNAALESLRERQKAQRAAALSPHAFVEQQRGLDEARGARERALEVRRALLQEKARLERAVELLPVLARHDALIAALSTDAEAGAQQAEAAPGSDALDELLRDLERRFGSTRQAEAELPRRRADLALLEREIAALRARLGRAGEVARAIDTPARTRLRKLADEQRGLLREQAELERARLVQDSERARFAAQLAAIDVAPLAGLALLAEQAEREQLETAIARVDGELERKALLVARGSAQLGLRLDPAALSRLALPDESALNEIDQAHQALEAETAHLRVRAGELAQTRGELEHRRALLLAEGELASLSELAEARALRDCLFAELRELAQPGGAEGEPLRAYEASVRRADELADRLRREASRASELARLDAELENLDERSRAVERAQREQASAASELSLRFRALLQDTGLGGTSPRGVRPKLLKLGNLLEQATEHESLAAASARAHRRADELALALAAELGVQPAGDTAAIRLRHVLGLARARLEQHGRRVREAEALGARQRELEAAGAASAARAGELTRLLGAWEDRFAAELAALGLAAHLSPDEVLACLDDLSELQQKAGAADALRTQISGVEGDVAALTHDVRALAARVVPEAGALPLEQALEALSLSHRTRREFERDREHRKQELEKAREQLRERGDGTSLGQVRAALQGLEPDVARARLMEIESELEPLEDEIAALHQTIGSKEAGLSLLEQPSSAVALAEDVESELSSVRALTRRYIEVRTALALLSHEVERYRAQHQGPVLSRAGALFPRLTLGRYRGLDVDYDERDEPVLCCVHESGKTVRVGGLSDGTRDQLYLALRIASIERFMESNPPLPLVLDDAFVHFDDQRAEAALAVLGELCAQTQVLFFTHHARMIDLAKRALGRERLMLHELDPARGVINQRDDGPLFARV